MSEQEQPGRVQPHPQPQQSPQVQPTSGVVVDDSAVLPMYTNFCRVVSTPEEVILDTGLNPQPFTTGRQHVQANHRIVMNFYTTKRLLAAIGTTIQRHEQTFGPIELDINRRVSPQPPRSAPAVTQIPPGEPDLLKTR